jgi:hypothetical protein
MYEIGTDATICIAWCDCSRALLSARGDTRSTRTQPESTAEVDMSGRPYGVSEGDPAGSLPGAGYSTRGFIE